MKFSSLIFKALISSSPVTLLTVGDKISEPCTLTWSCRLHQNFWYYTAWYKYKIFNYHNLYLKKDLQTQGSKVSVSFFSERNDNMNFAENINNIFWFFALITVSCVQELYKSAEATLKFHYMLRTSLIIIINMKRIDKINLSDLYDWWSSSMF